MLYILTKDNYNEINKILCKKKTIVLYHWNNCVHCLQLIPIWNEICKKYVKNKNINIINAELEYIYLLKKKYKKNISGFPTIIKYKNGKRFDEFHKERTIDNLNDFIIKK